MDDPAYPLPHVLFGRNHALSGSKASARLQNASRMPAETAESSSASPLELRGEQDRNDDYITVFPLADAFGELRVNALRSEAELIIHSECGDRIASYVCYPGEADVRELSSPDVTRFRSASVSQIRRFPRLG